MYKDIYYIPIFNHLRAIPPLTVECLVSTSREPMFHRWDGMGEEREKTAFIISSNSIVLIPFSLYSIKMPCI